MPILIGLGLIVFIFLYIKFSKFRGAVNHAAKKSPEALRKFNEHAQAEIERKKRK